MEDIYLISYQSKEKLKRSVPGYWLKMRDLLDDYMEDGLLPELITPIACCKAVGGEIEDTVEINAAILAAEISVRLLDDLTDQDKPNALYQKIGAPRTLNYVDAFRTLGYKVLTNKCLEDARYLKILKVFTDCYLVVLAGQDRDLQPGNINWEEAWKSVEMKTGYIYASTAKMGAMAATGEEVFIDACKKYGYHLGLAIQLFNDMDGIWEPEGLSDLQQGKITLPILYALQCQHDANKELLAIVQQNRIAEEATRVKAILDTVDAKGYLLWSALKQRESGLEAIRVLPDNEGRQMLEAHFTGMFGDIDELLTENRPATPPGKSFQTGLTLPATDGLSREAFNVPERSTALGIRKKLRGLSA